MKKDLKAFRHQCQQYPIMADEALDLIISYLKSDDKILEIGTCVGYSSIYLASHVDVSITTIERDAQRASLARQNLEDYKNITLLEVDALEVSMDGIFDVIIFDAAKAQNKIFLAKFIKNLRHDGLIFVDNVHFHGFVENPDLVKDRKNLYRMVLKMKSFVDEMLNSDFEVTIHDVGDGLMIIKNPS
ncbi:MAG TPA: methyltransferase domain-containing protein [Erysipelothrix sp.]|nr:methyltransferase domain-containing protein [Erysipelothrix sp.]